MTPVAAVLVTLIVLAGPVGLRYVLTTIHTRRKRKREQGKHTW